MEKRSLRTKIEAGILIFFLVLFSIAGVVSLTRRFTPAQDTVETFIKNSNGNMWEATGDNIQAAIDNLGMVKTDEGWGMPKAFVWLSSNTTFTISSTIYVDNHTILDMQGSQIRPNGDFDVFVLFTGSQVINGMVNTSDVTGYSSSIYTFDWDWHLKSIGMHEHRPIVRDMELYSNGTGTGIYAVTHWDGNYWQYGYADFDTMKISGFEYGIHLNNEREGTGSYVNGLMFGNIIIYDCVYPIKVRANQSECAGNYFNNIHVNCTNRTEYIIWHNDANNFFCNIYAHNWDNDSGTKTSYNFTEHERTDNDDYGAHGVFLSFHGGGDDIAVDAWHRWDNCYTFIDLDSSKITCGKVVENNP